MRTFFYSSLGLLTLLPLATISAQVQDIPLVNLPINDASNFSEYINAIYAMFISIAALIAVVKIIIAGVKYMFSDIVTQKSQAKNDIKGALLGLVVVLAAVLILTVINPDLIKFNPQLSEVAEPAPPPENTGGVPAVEACMNAGDSCRVQPCTPPVGSLRTDYNCDAAEAACRADGGSPGPRSSNGQALTCINAS